MNYVPPDYSDPCYSLDQSFLDRLKVWRAQPDWARRRFMLGKPTMRDLAREQGRNKRFLYKYLAFDSNAQNADLERKKVADLLVAGQLYLSAFSQFNDPNEFRASLSFTNDMASLRQWAEQGARQKISPHSGPGAEAAVVQMAAEILARVNGNSQLLQQAYEGQLSRFGIYCFSRNPRSHLMWAHYARSHRGICVQLDPTKCEGVLSAAQTVRYSSELPRIEWPLEDRATAINGVLTKSSEWEYEAELRYVSRKVTRNTIKFDARAVTGIITGLRFDDDIDSGRWLEHVLADRRSAGLPELNMYRIVSDPKEYGLLVRSAPVKTGKRSELDTSRAESPVCTN